MNLDLKFRPEQKELQPLETQRLRRPDYCLHCLSAGPLQQPIPILEALQPRPWKGGAGSGVAGYRADRQDRLMQVDKTWALLDPSSSSACSPRAIGDQRQSPIPFSSPETHFNYPDLDSLKYSHSCPFFFDLALNFKGKQWKASVMENSGIYFVTSSCEFLWRCMWP